jgi:hypothetical protein
VVTSKAIRLARRHLPPNLRAIARRHLPPNLRAIALRLWMRAYTSLCCG